MPPADVKKRLTAIQAIHEYCMEDCCGGNRKGPGLCSDENCRFFPFRAGCNPYYKLSNKPTRPRERKSGRFRPSYHGGKAILQTVTDGKKRKDPKSGKSLRTEKVIHDREILIEGKYRLVRVEADQ